MMRSVGRCCVRLGRVVVAEAQQYVVEYVPRDVEADLVAGLAPFGVEAASEVPEDRVPGMVRVSRTGGALRHQKTRDGPEVLVETWGEDAVEAFDIAQRVWAVFRTWEIRGFITPGVVVHDMDLDVPRTRDDELAPELHRCQFVVSFTTDLTEIELTEEATNG